MPSAATEHPPVAFITGAASGMGRLSVDRLLDSGWHVAATDVNTDALASLEAREGLLTFALDVCDEAAVDTAVDRIEAELGAITRVMHGAAIMPFGAALEMDAATTRRVMDINYGGLINVAHATLPGMIARGAGEFVSFASMAGHVPIFYVAAYNASKFATAAYTEVLHQETRHTGVLVTCVCPPAVETPLLEQGRTTRWPQFLNLLPPIAPETVLNAVERGLRRRKLWVFPGWYAKPTLWFRRLLPSLLWRFMRLVERPRATLDHVLKQRIDERERKRSKDAA